MHGQSTYLIRIDYVRSKCDTNTCT